MGKNLAKAKTTFYFCDGSSCRKAGSEAALRTARAHLRNKGLWDETHNLKTRCNGRCEDAPTWIVQQGNFWYKHVDAEKARAIIDQHCDFNEPLVSELIYRDGQDHVASEKERPPAVKPAFKTAQDQWHGNVFKARGFHSDQYLYAFFLFLEQNPGYTSINTPDGRTLNFFNLTKIDFTDPYIIQLHFGELHVEIVELVIALVPKTEDDELIKRRVTVCEHMIQISTNHKYVRLKDKMGRLAAEIKVDKADVDIWDYCLKIQLNNAKTPDLLISEQ